jgi:predicted Zn-dependent protease
MNAATSPVPNLEEAIQMVHASCTAIENGVDPLSASASGRDLVLLAQRADELCEAGRFDDALPLVLELMLSEPANHRHFFMAAECAEAAGQADEAAHLFAYSKSLRPNAVTAYRLGRCLHLGGHIEGAIRAFDDCARLAGASAADSDALLGEEAAALASNLLANHSQQRHA